MVPNDFSLELVVARHEEDLRWLRRVPKSVAITLYDKGEFKGSTLPEEVQARKGFQRRCLPNVGREAHSYLTHLVENYENLSAVTVFCQGHPFDHAPDFHERLRLLAGGGECPDPFLWYGFLDETDDPCGRRIFVPWSKNPERRELHTGLLYELLFEEASPKWFCFRGGAQFAVTREAVQRRSREFYERALVLMQEIPESAHSLERMWDRFFGEPMIDPVDLGSDGVRYWKRIRRLEVMGAGKGIPTSE